MNSFLGRDGFRRSNNSSAEIHSKSQGSAFGRTSHVNFTRLVSRGESDACLFRYSARRKRPSPYVQRREKLWINDVIYIWLVPRRKLVGIWLWNAHPIRLI